MLTQVRSYLRFYRHYSPLELQFARVSFSQFGEDLLLMEQFAGKPNGVYVDVGAYHPIQYSNTYLFYRMGWRGLVIEPNPDSARKFVAKRPADEIAQFAISEQEGSREFILNGEMSGLDTNDYLHASRLTSQQNIRVETRTLRSVFESSRILQDKTIDFLDVDCEGHDEVILGTNDWQKWRPTIVLCEAYTKELSASLTQAMSSRGYERIAICRPSLLFRVAE